MRKKLLLSILFILISISVLSFNKVFADELETRTYDLGYIESGRSYLIEVSGATELNIYTSYEGKIYFKERINSSKGYLPNYYGDHFVVIANGYNLSEIQIDNGKSFNTAYKFDIYTSYNKNAVGNNSPNVLVPYNSENLFRVNLENNKEYLWFLGATYENIKIYDHNGKILKEVTESSYFTFRATYTGTFYIGVKNNFNETYHYIGMTAYELFYNSNPQEAYLVPSAYSSLDFYVYAERDRIFDIQTDKNITIRVEPLNVNYLFVDDGFVSYNSYRSKTGLYRISLHIEGNNNEIVKKFVSFRDGSTFEQAYNKPFNLNHGEYIDERFNIPENSSTFFKFYVEKDQMYEINYGDTHGIILYNSNKEKVNSTGYIEVKSDRSSKKMAFQPTDRGYYYVEIIGTKVVDSGRILVNRLYNFPELQDITIKEFRLYYEDRYGLYFEKGKNYYINITANNNVEAMIKNDMQDRGIGQSYGYRIIDKNEKNVTILFQPQESGTYFIELYAKEGTHVSIEGTSGLTGFEAVSKLMKEENLNFIKALSYVYDPIDTATGALVINQDLLSYSGKDPLNFSINYNSLLLNSGVMGKGWNNPFETKLVSYSYDAQIDIQFNSNQINTFMRNQKGEFYSQDKRMKDAHLEYVTNGYLLTLENKTKYLFSAVGKLKETINPKGEKTIYEYDNNGKLILVKQLLTNYQYSFTYNSKGYLESVKDNANRVVTFTYDSNDNLIEYTDANGNSNTFSYDKNGRVLTGTNTYGTVYMKNTYDFMGRVILQEDALNNVSILNYDDFSENNKIITTVTNREGKTSKYIHDYNYNLLEKVDELSNSIKYTYDEQGNILTQTDANGNQIRNSFDDQNNLLTMTNPLNKILEFSYDQNHNLLQRKDLLGNIISYLYDSNDNLISTTDRNGKTTTYEYDANNNLIFLIDSNGNKTSYHYQNGLLVSITDSENNSRNFEYDLLGRLIKTIDPNGNISTFEYDNNDNLTKTIDALGYTQILTYDSHNNVLSHTDSKGNITTYEYNENGKQVKEIKDNNSTLYQYDKEDKLIQVTDKVGNVTSYQYDDTGNLIQVTDAVGVQTTYTYDKTGNILTKYIDNELIESYFYDSIGRIIKSIDANGSTTTFSYDDNGNLSTITDASGNITTYTYDPEDRLLSVIDALNNTVSYSYDDVGNMVSARDAKGNITTFNYDRNYRLIKVINPLNQTNQYMYDKNGNLIQSFDALGNVQINEYDSLNQLIKQTDENGNSKRFEYDSLGNIVAIYDGKGNKILTNDYDSNNNLTNLTDALGNSVTNSYDAENNLISTIDALNRNQSFNVDGLGRVTSTNVADISSEQSYNNLGLQESLTDPNSNETTFLYDKLGQLLKEQNASGNSTNYEYDAIGNLTKYKNARNQEATYTYDAVGNIISAIDSAGTITYSYDQNYNLTSVKENDNNPILREYDSLNRLTKYTDQFGNNIEYVYDNNGNLLQMVYPDGKIVKYTYDKVGNLLTVTDWNNKTTTYTYDQNNMLTSATKPDGSVETRIYNIKGQLIEINNISVSGEVIFNETYEYDSVGNILREGNKNYTYDDLNRVITTDNGTYRYDSGGNLLSVNELNELNELTSVTDSTYNESIYNELPNSVTEVTYSVTDATYGDNNFLYGLDNRLSQYNDISLSYDNDGNLLNIPVNGQVLNGVYDSRNRLITIGDTEYTYDAHNRRIALTEGGITTRFVTNPNSPLDQLLMELNENGQPTAYYVYGLGLISKQDITGNNSYYHFDQRGSTVALTNDIGIVTDRYTYGVYGELLSKEGLTANLFLYNGRDGVVTDNNGLYYMRSRYYSPEIKRFINRDVIQGSLIEPQTFNRYSYVNGNPISYIDPFGLSRTQSALNIGSTIIDFVPVVGAVKGGLELVIGYDPITGNKLSGTDRVASGIGLIPIPGMKFAGKYATKESIQYIGKEAEQKLLKEEIQFITKKAEKYEANLLKNQVICPNCFVAGTLVLTKDGERPIEELKIGDWVLSKNVETGIIEYKQIDLLFQRDTEETFNITVGSETLTTTRYHAFWVKDKGWVEAEDLVVGDLFETADGQNLPIEKIVVKQEHAKLYNFRVEDFHTYYVSKIHLLTHNVNNPCSLSQLRNKAKNAVTNKDKGIIGEDYADAVFNRAGYSKLPSKVGSNNGFDGVYVKYDSNNNPIDIIINESKFGSSRLGNTIGGGKQMSNTWINYNIKKMTTSTDPYVKDAGSLLENNINLIRTRMNRLTADGASIWKTDPTGTWGK